METLSQWFMKAAVVLGLTLVAVGSARADLVLNGNFGTGDFTDWTLSGDSSSSFVITGQLTGTDYQAAITTNADDEGYLTQSLSTTSGQQYVLSFLLGGDGAMPNTFSASLGATTLLSLTNIPDTIPAGTPYTLDYTATSTTTVLSFAYDDAPGYLFLTNVSVTPLTSAVPEPASIIGVTLGSSMLLGYVWVNRRRLPAKLALRS